jgi:hypothetical protein
MNQSHIATIGAAGTAGAFVGVIVWLLHLCGVEVPTDVVGYMETLATAGGAYWFHKQGSDPENPTQGQG